MFSSIVKSVAPAIVGGIFGSKAAKSESSAISKANAQNLRFQRQFAKRGLRWRIKDARKAGIHPLAALGASLGGVTPATVPDTSEADFLQNMGQSLGRATNQMLQQPEEAFPSEIGYIQPNGTVTIPTDLSESPGQGIPGYKDKKGNWHPLPAAQAQNLMAWQHHLGQMKLMDAQRAELLANASKDGSQDMFIRFTHPRLGSVPFPNPDLGEVGEALANRRIAGLWLEELRQTPGLYQRLNNIVVQELGKSVGTIAHESPDLLGDFIRALINETVGE